jgi:dynein heavy chain
MISPCLVPHALNVCVFFSVQDGSAQAQSNLKFLSTLKEPCEELAEAKPKDIPAMLPKLLSLIRMIWMNSEHYKSRERLTSLLRKVKFSNTY